MIRRLVLTSMLVLFSVVVGGAAAFAGQGMLATSTQMSNAAAVSLQEQIAATRAAQPDIFGQVRRVIEDAPLIAAQTRNRRAMLTPLLRDLGPGALFPLLEYLVFVSPDRSRFTAQQWRDTQCTVLEATGMLRDARALPTLAVVLHDARQSAMVTRFAAEAVGRIGDDEAVRVLRAELAGARGERRVAILTGMGHCRRVAVARLLAAELRQSGPGTTRSALIEALRDVGNAWAWETTAIGASGEGDETRRTAAAALVTAFARFSDTEREQTIKALQVINHPSTSELVRRAKAEAGAGQAAAFDRLLARLAVNPLGR